MLGPVNLTRAAWLLAAAALTVLAGCGKTEEGKKAEAAPKTVHASVLTVDNPETPGVFRVTGTVRAMFNATLSSKVLGRVSAVHVREGDTVQEGQAVVDIDSRELASAVQVADASYRASVVGVGSARTAADMEAKTSAARLAQAQSQVQQAQAYVAAAEARRDLAVAGPRTQEVAQAHIAVVQAESSLKLAATELDRTRNLVREGAVAQRDLDLAQNQYDLAKGRRDTAVQAEAIAKEGSRSQEIKAAQDAVNQAKAALREAQSGVAQAKAAAMLVEVRKKEVEVASAQSSQAAAAAQAAKVSLSYSRVSAPFAGRVVARSVDPGAMASPGSPLVSVEGGEYRFEAVVPEGLVAGLAKGQSVRIKIDALPGQELDGRVVEIVPQGDSTSHSFVVKLSLGMPPGVKSGMFGSAALVTPAGRRILIPADATWKKEGLDLVFVVNKDGVARLRIVTLGESAGGQVEVLSGLSKGDKVVVGDRSHVVDGVRIEAKGQ